MKQQRNVSVSKSVARAVPIVVVIAVFLGLTGCSRQMAKIDEQQTQLQMMVKANSLQIEDIAARLEKNQQEFNGLIESVQNNVAQVAVDVAAVADAQLKLRDTVLSNSRQLAEKIGTLGQSQEDLSAGLGRAISSVQSETRKVAADLTTVAADVTAVTAEQARLFETVQQNNQDLTNKVAVIEQIQQERQNTIGGMEDNISALAASISGLGEDVLRLQEILQSNIRELVSIAETEGQRQTEFQESIGESLQTLDNSFASLKASQHKMQSRIEQMQNDALDLRDMPAALDQLKDQLEELSRSRLPADDAGAIEYEASADTSAETNSIE